MMPARDPWARAGTVNAIGTRLRASDLEHRILRRLGPGDLELHTMLALTMQHHRPANPLAAPVVSAAPDRVVAIRARTKVRARTAADVTDAAPLISWRETDHRDDSPCTRFALRMIA